MNTALLANPSAIIPITGADLSGKEGYLLKESSGALALNDSATTAARAVVLEGNTATLNSSVGILGAVPGQVRLKATGSGSKFNLLQQVNDGTVQVDAGTGARVLVAVALEDFVDGQLVLAALLPPRIGA